MNFLVRNLILLQLTVMLSACSMFKPLPDVSIPRGAKIGLISLVDEFPEIPGVKSGSLDWNISERLFSALTTKLSARGYDVQQLDASIAMKENRYRLSRGGWIASHPTKVTTRALKKFNTEDNIDFVVIFSPVRHTKGNATYGILIEDCKKGKGIIRVYEELYKRCPYSPFVNVSIRVLSTDPAQIIGSDHSATYPEKIKIRFRGKDLRSYELNKAKETVWRVVESTAKTALIDAGILQR